MHNVEEVYLSFNNDNNSEKTWDLLPYALLSLQIHPYTLRRPNISEFSSAPQKAEWQKNKCLVEKTKGSDSYAISSAKFTTEAIATPAVLDTCTVGTMEHEKHPLTIYCSVQADTRTWNWWQLQFLSCCINAISTKPAMHLIQASICQKQSQWRQSGLLPPLPDPPPKKASAL